MQINEFKDEVNALRVQLNKTKYATVSMAEQNHNYFSEGQPHEDKGTKDFEL